MAKEKIKTADEAAAEYMTLQFSLRKESRFENVLLTVLTMGFIFFFAIFFWVLPDKDFSEEENTTLSSFPEFSKEGFIHGDFTADFGTYMADQFPCRNFFVGLKGISETAQLKGQNNNVIIGKDGYLIARSDYPDEGKLDNNLKAAGRFIPIAEKNGISCTVAFAGRKMDVMDEAIPALYGTYYSDRIFSILDEKAEGYGIDYLNLRNTLNEAEDTDLYYKTDHHWTSLGAYYAYCDIAKEMGITPYDLESFDIETASREFYGTTWSSAGLKTVDPDTIEYFRWEGDESLETRIRDPKYGYKSGTEINIDGTRFVCFNTPYITEMLEGKDKYASFLGGNNNGYVEVTMKGEDGSPVEGREKLIIIRDSFADSLAPFLARHFDLILLDLRTESPDTIALCKELGADRLLMLYNMETLTTSNDLGKLNNKLSSHDN